MNNLNQQDSTLTKSLINSTDLTYPRIKSINIGICTFSSTAELAINPIWSALLTASYSSPENNTGKISLETRKYFDNVDNKRRGFMSFRIGTSKNIGSAFGLNFTNSENTGFSVHVGAYTNLQNITNIKPTMGISFYLINF